jgi:AcrR family transcriptional regulator
VASTRDRLIDAATELLDRGGPAAVTLREVGRIAGVSHNAPYKHFADKQDLLAAIAARELMSNADPTASRRARRSTPVERVRHLMHRYVRWATAYPARFKLTFGPWTHDSPELAAAAAHARSEFVNEVIAAQAAHELIPGDPERIAALLLALTHGAADLYLSGHLSRTGKGRAAPEDLIDDLLAQLRPIPDRGGVAGSERR